MPTRKKCAETRAAGMRAAGMRGAGMRGAGMNAKMKGAAKAVGTKITEARGAATRLRK
jgi:hypothetical protein